MTRSGSGIRGRWAWVGLSAGLLAGLAGLTGCGEKPKSVEVVERPQPERKRRDAPPQPETAFTAPVVQAPPETPAPTPKPVGPQSSILMAVDMPVSTGRPDGEGGVILPSNGKVQIDNYKIDFTVNEILLEMKGDPARSVWPQVELNAFNRTIQKNYFPLARTFVTTSSYTMFRLPQKERPLPPGEYLITFSFYNNQDFPEYGEDRSAYVRRIDFLSDSLE